MIEIDHLSYSSISTYLECGRKWRYRYIEKIPTRRTPALVVGSAVHGAIEALITHRLNGEPLLPVRAWIDAWEQQTNEHSATDIDWNGGGPREYENIGARLFADPEVQAAIADLHPAVDQRGPLIERRVELRVPGVTVPVIGYLDMVAGDGVIVDFKTAARNWTRNQAQQETQPIFYLAALNQLGVPHAPSRFRHVVFVKTKIPQVQIIDTERSPAELFWLTRLIADVWRAIEGDHFPANPKACFNYGRRCEFYNICRGTS